MTCTLPSQFWFESLQGKFDSAVRFSSKERQSEATTHSGNTPVSLDIPCVVYDGLLGDTIRGAFVYTVPNSAPYDNQQRDAIVS